MIDLAKERRLRATIANATTAITDALAEVALIVESQVVATTEPTPAVELVDYETAAKILSIGESTLYNMVRRGLLASVDLPGEGEKPIRRIDRRELDRFVAAHSKVRSA